MVAGQVRGFVKITVTLKDEPGFRTKGPHLQFTIENSKFTIKPKDASRLTRLGEQVEFARIIESKSNVNWKVAKIISNALRIQIDWNQFSSAKTVVLVPV